jgi:hypothetical protein
MAMTEDEAMLQDIKAMSYQVIAARNLFHNLHSVIGGHQYQNMESMMDCVNEVLARWDKKLRKENKDEQDQ